MIDDRYLCEGRLTLVDELSNDLIVERGDELVVSERKDEENVGALM